MSSLTIQERSIDAVRDSEKCEEVSLGHGLKQVYGRLRYAVTALETAPEPQFLSDAMTSKRRVSAKIQKAAASNNGAPQKTPPVRRIKHKRGGLESMPHMPLDILVEVRSEAVSRI